MGFNSYHNKPQSPAKVFHRWKGGEGKLIHWDGTVENTEGGQGAEVEAKLPFKFAVLEQTRRISGFAPQGTGVRFYSNEAVAYDDELRVMRKEGDKPAEEVIKGKYAEIKDKLPQGARLAVQLYVYNPETEQIECITCQGASLGAFIEFSKKNRIYENYVSMKKGEETKNGAVTFFPPEYTVAEAYTKEDKDVLQKADDAISEFLKSVHNNVPSDDVDQTPSSYEGEQSQEIVEEKEKESDVNPVDFNALPF
jgi:hypothetical protein